jgi:predicted phage-related endonuclease
MPKLTDDAIEIGASRMAAIMGLSPWSTPNDELARTVAAIDGEATYDAPNGFMLFGTYMERGLRDWAEDDLGVQIMVPTTVYRAPEHRLGTSIDGLIIDQTPLTLTDYRGEEHVIDSDKPVVVEFKVAGFEDPPIYYLIQVQHQLLVTGYDIGILCWIDRRWPGERPSYCVIQRHQPTMEMIVEAAAEFWAHVSNGTQYPPHNGQEANRLIKGRGREPVTIGHNQDPGGELPDLVANYLGAKRAIEAGETLKGRAETRIKEILGDIEVADIPGFQICWTTTNCKAQPEKVTPAKPAYTTRRFTVKEV